MYNYKHRCVYATIVYFSNAIATYSLHTVLLQLQVVIEGGDQLRSFFTRLECDMVARKIWLLIYGKFYIQLKYYFLEMIIGV